MCSKWNDDTRFLPVPSFPEGWRFFFEDPKEVPNAKKDAIQNNWLKILSPNGRHYFSVEKAINHNKKALRLANAKTFKRFAGLMPSKPSACGECSLCKRKPCKNCFACCTDSDDCFQTVSVWTLFVFKVVMMGYFVLVYFILSNMFVFCC